MNGRVRTWAARASWACAVVGSFCLLGYLMLRVWIGFGISPRYALGFDDGGPLFYASASVIIPGSIVGGMLAALGHRRGAFIVNSVVLAIFLGYGALALLLM